MRVADQLRASGRVIRGRIGVTIAPVTKEVAESIGLGAPRGALVQGVEAGGPADKAGVEAGDIIMQGRRQGGREVGRPAAHRSAPPSRAPKTHAAGVPPRQRPRDIAVTVAEFEPERPRRARRPRRAAARRTAEDGASAWRCRT